MVLRVDTSQEVKLCRFIAAVVLSIFLTNVLAGLAEVFNFSAERISLTLKLILGGLFILMLPIIVQRFKRHLMVFLLAAVLISLVNIILFPKVDEYFRDTMMTYFTFCLPTYIVCYEIRDYSKLNQEITRVSWVIATMVAVFLVVMLTTGQSHIFNNGKYSMGLGYACVIPALFLAIDYSRKRRMLSLIAIAVLLVAIISFGSRGPLLAVLPFAAYFWTRYYIFEKKYFKGVLVAGGTITVMVVYKSILLWFADILLGQGVQSRTIRTMTTDKLYLSGRDLLYQQLLSEIMDNPLAVRGINAEWSVIGVYAHNIALELLYQLGLVIGGGVIAVILYRVFRTLIFRELDERRITCIAFMFASVPQLLVSSSLWTNHNFWIWMALITGLLHEGKEALPFAVLIEMKRSKVAAE